MHVDEGAKVAKQLKHSEQDYEKQYNTKNMSQRTRASTHKLNP